MIAHSSSIRSSKEDDDGITCGTAFVLPNGGQELAMGAVSVLHQA
jgi:hypothetical protein